MSDELEVVQQLPEHTFEVQPPVVRKLLSLENLWDTWVALKGSLSPATRKEYDRFKRMFCGFMRGKAFSPDTMTQWVLDLQAAKHDPYYINKINCRVRPFLRWLRVQGQLPPGLSECIPSLRTSGPKDAVCITEEEYQKIKKYAKTKQHFIPHLWLCILSYRTGMSMKDCCYLRWRNVHMDPAGPSWIEIHRIKTERFGTGAKCVIPLIPGTDIWDWLVFLRKAPRYNRHDGIDDYVHQDTTGLYECHWQVIHHDFKQLFQRAGVEKGKTFKNFRNSFCTNLVNSEVQVSLIMQMTGHRNIKTLLRYLKPDVKALQDGLARAFQYAAAKAGVAETDRAIITFEDEPSETTEPNEHGDTNDERGVADGLNGRGGDDAPISLPETATGNPSQCSEQGVVD